MYTQEQQADAVIPSTNAYLTPVSLTAAAAAYCRFLVLKPMNLKRVYLAVTTNITSESSNAIMAVYQNKAFGVTTSQVSIASITPTTGSTIGQVFINQSFTPVSLYAGQELAFTITKAATSTATAAGAALVGFDYDLQPEVPTNETATGLAPANLSASSVVIVTA